MTKPQKKIVGLAWVALMIWGLVGVMQRLVYGHLLADYGSYVPWGLWVAGKIYFIGLAEGVSFFAWVCYAFQIERFRGLVRPALWLSLVNMVVGLTIISFDLGHMWRLPEVFFRPNFSSLLTISSWLSMGYMAYIAVILAMEVKSYSLATKTYRLLGWIGMALAIIFSGGNGAEFATLISSPYWHTALGPVLSIGYALSSGLALILAVTAFFYFTDSSKERETLALLSRTVVGLLFLVIILEWSEFSVTMWYGRDRTYTVLWSILFGSLLVRLLDRSPSGRDHYPLSDADTETSEPSECRMGRPADCRGPLRGSPEPRDPGPGNPGHEGTAGGLYG